MNASSMNEKTALERESKSDANQSIVTSEEELTEISINLSHQPMPPLGPFREDHPKRYVVKKGDTLWEIANRFLVHQWQWEKVWVPDSSRSDPTLIYPGDVLVMRTIGGEPRLTLQGSGISGSENTHGAEVGFDGLPVVHLSPKARESQLSIALPTIPGYVVDMFVDEPYVVSEQTIARAPHVVGTEKGRVVAGAGDRIYVRSHDDEAVLHAGKRYHVVRLGDKLRHPKEETILGYKVDYLGTASIRQTGVVAEAKIDKGRAEIMPGDLLLTVEHKPLSARFMPHAPPVEFQARIVALHQQFTRVGQFQVVTLSAGAQSGLEPGHVLGAYKPSRRVTDPRLGDKVSLPREKAGLLLVFAADDNLGYAMVMESKDALERLDPVGAP